MLQTLGWKTSTEISWHLIENRFRELNQHHVAESHRKRLDGPVDAMQHNLPNGKALWQLVGGTTDLLEQTDRLMRLAGSQLRLSKVEDNMRGDSDFDRWLYFVADVSSSTTDMSVTHSDGRVEEAYWLRDVIKMFDASGTQPEGTQEPRSPE